MDIDKEIREPYSAPDCVTVRIEPSQVVCGSALHQDFEDGGGYGW